MKVSLMFPSDFVKADDLDGKDVTKTIKAVTMDELTMAGGKKKTSPVIRFSDTDKKLVLNKTNTLIIAGMHGKETDLWIGKKITMFPTETQFGSDTVSCIRIRKEVK